MLLTYKLKELQGDRSVESLGADYLESFNSSVV
jgi:hypothetical protein